uniref:Uncharacterized protein n=1 Tax=Medicago truncatula TaxID=3880 RepID=I3ST79_MEDTR|nr:unknown [Medicago truncatula]
MQLLSRNHFHVKEVKIGDNILSLHVHNSCTIKQNMKRDTSTQVIFD